MARLHQAAPNPTLQQAATEFALIGSKAVLWDPVPLWGDAASPTCTSCVYCPGKGQRDGAAKIRKVCGMDTTYFIIASKYRCTHSAQVSSLHLLKGTTFNVIAGGCTCKSGQSMIT